MVSLNGFANVMDIDDLVLTNNQALTTIENFAAVDSIQGALTISQNPNLTELPVFNNLTFVGGISIFSNPLITHLNSFANITTVSGSISIFRLPGITTLNPFSNLTTLGEESSIVIDSLSISSLEGFHNIGKIRQDIRIANCAQLENLTALSNIDMDTLYQLVIENNDLITSLEGFESLTEIYDLRVNQNDNLIELTGLNNLSNIKFILVLLYNNQLNDVSALSNAGFSNSFDITYFTLGISGNSQLSNINGLEGLQSEKIYLSIVNNDNLEDISSFNNLSSLYRLEVSGNNSLSNLTGLDNVTNVTSQLILSDNPNLENCNGLCALLENDGVGGSITIQNNLLSCNSYVEILNNCATPTENIMTPKMHLFPNPASTKLYIRNADLEIFQFQIFNLTGQLVGKGNTANGQITLNYLPGIYFVELSNSEGIRATEKIIIE